MLNIIVIVSQLFDQIKGENRWETAAFCIEPCPAFSWTLQEAGTQPLLVIQHCFLLISRYAAARQMLHTYMGSSVRILSPKSVGKSLRWEDNSVSLPV